MLISLNPGLVPLGDSRLADLKKPISETQSPVLCSQSEYQPGRKGLPALFSRHFPQLDLSTVVAPSGGVNEHKLRGSGHRTISPSKGRVPPSNRRAPDHLEYGVSLCFLALAPHRHAFILDASKALWDANSTTVCWGCQGNIPIYCIPVLTSGMLAPPPGFSTNSLPGESFLAAEDRQE